jgi:C1A family cysteine protease
MFTLNFKKSPDDNRDYKIAFKAITEPPKLESSGTPGVVDLSEYHTVVKNQGSIGSCTAFATVALMEYNYKRYTTEAKDDVYSEKFTYYVTRVDVSGWTTDDTGAYMRQAFDSARIYGAAPEETAPYDNDYRTKPGESAYKAALKNQILTYARVNEDYRPNTLRDLKTLLDQGYCFVGGFVCYESLWDSSVSKTGIIPPPHGTMIGGHAVCFVGYDDTKDLLKFKNSWGTHWGDNGYGYLPYSYVLTGMLWDLWTAFTQENFDNASVIGWEKGKSRDIPTAEPEVLVEQCICEKHNPNLHFTEKWRKKHRRGRCKKH